MTSSPAMHTRSHARRLARLVAPWLLLLAICACGRGPRAEGSSEPAVAPAVAPAVPAEAPVTLPDSLMPLAEGGTVQPRDPGVSTLSVVFPNDQFEQVRTRVREWMPAHGWTLVPGSEVDAESAARTLEELGQREAAALARQTPTFGASYQRDGHTVAVNLDGLDGALTLNLNWF